MREFREEKEEELLRGGEGRGISLIMMMRGNREFPHNEEGGGRRSFEKRRKREF